LLARVAEGLPIGPTGSDRRGSGLAESRRRDGRAERVTRPAGLARIALITSGVVGLEALLPRGIRGGFKGIAPLS
jgi:hypothetical protein